MELSISWLSRQQDLYLGVARLAKGACIALKERGGAFETSACIGKPGSSQERIHRVFSALYNERIDESWDEVGIK